MRKRPAFIAFLTLVSGTAREAGAFDKSDLDALQIAVHGLCSQPDQKGEYMKIEGDLNAGATLKVVGVSGSGKITKEKWDGISQLLDKYAVDPRQCAMSIVPILIAAMSPKDCSGRKVDSYGREFPVTRDSPEMGGGHNQKEWCDSLVGTLRGEHTPDSAFTVLSSGEHTNNHCAPFNCPQYVYTCTVKVQTDPICH